MSMKMFLLLRKNEILGYKNDGDYKAEKDLKCGFCGCEIPRGNEYYFVSNNTYLDQEDGRLGRGMVPGDYCCDSHAGQKSWNRMKWRRRQGLECFVSAFEF